ncbi:putative AB-hydrolase YheT [Carpediemonas membranifera]|uniref:Putative AB-hydrolase YheT n=1 Tax=Carpediemonas membranifera TaxID=201153 RepID=A0A8J6B7A2_9EUKA|nr:putative AB-hydrolase YheT [Carpediemonas membranifera]|eukprot:KAG9397128.1 putative AB-hydrolase YheT [Carpediemonas membranifera]
MVSTDLTDRNMMSLEEKHDSKQTNETFHSPASIPDLSGLFTDYHCPWRYMNGYVATMAAFKPSNVRAPYVREELTTTDGDFIDLDICSPENDADDAPIVVVLHGLGSSSYAAYIQKLAVALRQEGIRTVAMNLRSSSRRPNKTPVLYNGMFTLDVECTVALLTERYPCSKIALAGYSLGGAILTHYTATCAPPPAVCGLYTCCSPMSLRENVLDDHWLTSRLIKPAIMPFLHKVMKEKAERFPKMREHALAAAIATDITEFDRNWTCKVFEYDTPEAYYEDASADNVIQDIAVPTLMLFAKNDPLATPSMQERAWGKINANEYVTAVVQKRGGHQGFVSKEGDWLEVNEVKLMKRFFGME